MPHTQRQYCTRTYICIECECEVIGAFIHIFRYMQQNALSSLLSPTPPSKPYIYGLLDCYNSNQSCCQLTPNRTTHINSNCPARLDSADAGRTPQLTAPHNAHFLGLLTNLIRMKPYEMQCHIVHNCEHWHCTWLTCLVSQFVSMVYRSSYMSVLNMISLMCTMSTCCRLWLRYVRHLFNFNWAHKDRSDTIIIIMMIDLNKLHICWVNWLLTMNE